MGATRGTSLFVVGAVLGSLALGTAGGTAAATARSAAPGAVDTAASAPTADELRKAAGEALKAMDEDETLQEAAETVRRCSAAPALPEEPGRDCVETEHHHDSLLRARAELEKQAAEPAPDRGVIIKAVELADAARNGLLARQPKSGPQDGSRDGATDAVGGLLSVVTGVVSGLLGTVTGLVGTVTGLLTGLVGGLLG
ncbi:hypothetical protein AB8O64_03665 [Streptomyces sp. QH1-20]|uniref:hypothetical protein n=1 Tax=Streptomyces sp. QH1-20 TaxID=3240934 RepID=UPI0035179CE2